MLVRIPIFHLQKIISKQIILLRKKEIQECFLQKYFMSTNTDHCEIIPSTMLPSQRIQVIYIS